MKQLIYFSLLILIVACSSDDKAEIPIAEVKEGLFEIEVTEEGEIKAIQSRTISSPSISWRFGQLKITNFAEDGAEVEQGDTIIVFDPSEVKKAIVDSEDQLEINKADLEKLKAQQKLAIEELEADYKVAVLDQQISQIRFESSDYEADIKKKEIKLNLDKANISLDKAKDEIENRKKIQYEELQQSLLGIQQAESQLEDAHATLSKLFCTAPTEGIIIINRNRRTDTKFQVGDQVWSGYPLIELPDLSELKAEVNVNEVDVSKIKIGSKVSIKLDAYSDTIYTGEIISIANLAVNKSRDSKIKVFPVEILIHGQSNQLMPGLTVSCKIVVDEIEDVVSIPLEALNNDGNNDFVYLKSGVGFKKKNIKTAEANNDYIIVTKGLSEGDKVALANPFAEEEKENASSDQNE